MSGTIELMLQDGASIPERQTKGAAGYDLRSNLRESLKIFPNSDKGYMVGTGVHMNMLSNNVCAQILMRSGLAKLGLVLGNSVGLIDSDYTGEVKLNLWNRGDTVITIGPGDRIAQLVFLPIIIPNLVEVTEFSRVTDRGSNGFGSTGS